MPHYKDGTEAKVGDIVRGKPYNTPHEIVGEIISITPGVESCNCVVAFAEVRDATEAEAKAQQELGLFALLTLAHTYGGTKRVIGKADHGETKAFAKV